MTSSRYLFMFLPPLLGVLLPVPAEGQWVPFSAKFRQQTYRSLPNSSQELIDHSGGILHRASSGSEMRTWINAATQEKKGATFKDAATGKVHQINHDRRESRVVRQLPIPLLPQTPPFPTESDAVQTEVINGVQCIVKPVVVNLQNNSGSACVSNNLHLIVKHDITFPDGRRLVVEFYDFQYVEPSASHFEIPADYTKYDAP